MTFLLVRSPDQKLASCTCLPFELQLTNHTGQTEVVETNGSADGDDFLARERAALGDDANQFATPGDRVATVEDDDDLLGGEHQAQHNATSEEISEFETSFPVIDAQNEVGD